MKRINAKLEYAYLLEEFGFNTFSDCTDEENKEYLKMIENGEELPENVVRKIDEAGNWADEFQYSEKGDMADNDRMLYLQMKKIKELRAIKYGLIYLSVMLTAAMFILIYCR